MCPERESAHSVLRVADAVHVSCATPSDTVADAAAELEDAVQDFVDATDGTAVLRRECEKEVLRLVRLLGRLGCVVSTGLRHHGLRVGNGPLIPWCTGFLVVAPKAEAKGFAVVEREGPLRFR